MMAMATATAGGGSNDDNGAALDVKDGGVEVIGVDGNNEDCGVDAGSSLTAVVVNGGGDGMEPMEPIGVNEGCSKTSLPPQPSTAAAVDDGRHCHRQ